MSKAYECDKCGKLIKESYHPEDWDYNATGNPPDLCGPCAVAYIDGMILELQDRQLQIKEGDS